MASELEGRVIRLIDTRYNRERINVLPTSTLRSKLRMTEKDLCSLLFDLEDEFDIAISDDEMEPLDRVSEVVDLIETKKTKV